MNILVVCQHYWPEPYLLPDLCEELVRRGHRVHVVTDLPNYPGGTVLPEYRFGQNRLQHINGVTVHRTFTIGRRHNALFRFFNYYSYCLSASRFVRRMEEPFDVILAYQTSPVMMAMPALVCKRQRHIPVLLYCLDLWPCSLCAGGIRSDSLLYRYYHRVSRRIYRGADRLAVSSRGYEATVCREFSIPRERLVYLPQYAQHEFASPPKPPESGLELVFAGNVGKAQSVQTIIRAAALLRQMPALHWHIAGEGSALTQCRCLARRLGVRNITFHGQLQGQALEELYRRADAMLVTMIPNPDIGTVLPLKLLSCMASGKPVIAAADGEIRRIIREAACGLCANAADARGLAQAVREFAGDPDRSRYGVNARAYYEAHFTRARFFDTLEAELTALAQSGVRV